MLYFRILVPPGLRINQHGSRVYAMKKVAFAFSIILLLSLAACASSTTHIAASPILGETKTSTPVPTMQSAINHESAPLKPTETIKLVVSDAQNVMWTSSNPYVASVDQNGIVIGRHKGGIATITGKADGVVYTCTVTNTVNMRDNTAKQALSEMKIGTNYASALDVIDWDFNHGFDPYAIKHNGLDKLHYYLTKTGDVPPTTDMIRIFKEAGYDSIRLNVSWSLYTNDQTYKIDDDFLNTVEQYVSAILDNGMYCILNSHYDYLNRSWVGDKWAEDWMRPEYKSYVDARFKAIWKQVADRFSSYDDYLIFEPMNEPCMSDSVLHSTGSEKDMEQMQRDRVNELNKLFYDTVRSSGGNNEKRVLALSPALNNASELQYLNIPNDDKLMVEVHYYYQNDDGGPVTEWSSSNSLNTKKVDEEFKTIKQYINKTGIPIILGEWGSTAAMPIEERIDQATYIIKKARNLGIPCFWWECGWKESEGANENFPLFDRHNMQWAFPDLLKAIMECVQ